MFLFVSGMIIYCILNPDAKFPFYIDAKQPRQQSSSLARFNFLKLFEDIISGKTPHNAAEGVNSKDNSKKNPDVMSGKKLLSTKA